MNGRMVSVVILNYNGLRNLGKILHDCLSSVLQTDYPSFEVIFVDNASTDGSVDLIRRKFGFDKRLRIIQNSINLGFAEGNNVGMRRARGKYIVLLNNDTKVDSLWLKELVKTIEPADVGAVQGKLLQMSEPNRIDCAGGLIDYYGYHLERGRGEDSSKYAQTDDVFYAKGAAVILKREVLRKTGLFDSDLFLYYDETDLCWRIRLAGYRVLFAPGSIVYHASGLTVLKVYDRKKLYFTERNHLMILIKNYSLDNMLTAVAVSVLYEIRNTFLFLVKRKPLVSLALCRALLWNLLHLRKNWEKRRNVQELIRKVPDEEIKKAMLNPYPPFPLYLVFSRYRYYKNRQKVNT